VARILRILSYSIYLIVKSLDIRDLVYLFDIEFIIDIINTLADTNNTKLIDIGKVI
jgi:hypothetical protein